MDKKETKVLNFMETVDKRLTKIERAILGDKKILTFQEAHEYTGYAKSYLYKLTSSGRIPCYKPTGKAVFFEREELDNFLLSNKEKDT